MTTKSYAMEWLGKSDVTVKDILRVNHKTADFFAILDDCKVLIEEKERIDNKEKINKKEKTLSKGKIHLNETAFTRNNRLSGIIGKGAKQLASSASYNMPDFRLIWFTATGSDSGAIYNQLIATLYGKTNIYELGKNGLKVCYFFHNSDFYNHTDMIDGVISAYISGGDVHPLLCLNPYSHRYEKFRDSAFARIFGKEVIDPVAEEEGGRAYIVDTNINRKDSAAENAILQFCRKNIQLAP